MSARQRPVKDGLASWIYLALTVAAVILVAGPFQSYGIILVVFVEYFNESNNKIGWVFSTGLFLVFATSPLVVFLFRRFGFRPIVIVSALMFSLAFISTPFVETFGYLFLTFSIPMGLCFGFVDHLTVISLPGYFDKYLGVATGIRFAATSTGSMLFSYLYPILIDAIGWKKTFFSFSSFAVFIFAYSMAYSKPASRQELTPDKILATDHEIEAVVEVRVSSRMSYKFLRKRGFLLVMIGSLPFVFAVGGPAMFIVVYAKALGYPLSKSKWLLVVQGIGSLLGRAGIGYIADIAAKRRKVSYIADAAAILFGISSGLCSLTQSLPLMILYMGFIGCMEGVYWVISPLMMNELTFGQNADYAYSMMMLITAFGFLLGPPIMGYIYDVTGDFRNVLYAVCAGTTTAGVVMAFGTYLTLREAASTHAQMKQDTLCLKKYGLNDLKLLGNNSPSGLLEFEKLTRMEYETAV